MVRADVPAVGHNPGGRAELWRFFFRGREIMGGAGAVSWCLSVICGGGELSGGGAERCQVGCEPTLHRRLRPGRGWRLCFLRLNFFRGFLLGCNGCRRVWFLGRCW